MSDIVERLNGVRRRMARACDRAGRPVESVRLIAVAKRQPNDFIRAAFQAGLRDFGENYMQELTAKAAELSDLEGIRWRFIGHLQRNKAKDALRVCHSVDTVDSPRLAETLHKRAEQNARTLDVMIQVNVGSEGQKAGCEVGEVESLARVIDGLGSISLCGLMVIPPAEAEPEQCRPWFRQLRELSEGLGLRELSMGMSADMEVAIEEGATMIRVGTAIFGPRPPLQRQE